MNFRHVAVVFFGIGACSEPAVPAPVVEVALERDMPCPSKVSPHQKKAPSVKTEIIPMQVYKGQRLVEGVPRRDLSKDPYEVLYVEQLVVEPPLPPYRRPSSWMFGLPTPTGPLVLPPPAVSRTALEFSGTQMKVGDRTIHAEVGAVKNDEIYPPKIMFRQTWVDVELVDHCDGNVLGYAPAGLWVLHYREPTAFALIDHGGTRWMTEDADWEGSVDIVVGFRNVAGKLFLLKVENVEWQLIF